MRRLVVKDLQILRRSPRLVSLLVASPVVLSLPIVLLALVPAGAVSDGLYDATAAISAAFPLKPALRALDGALNGGEIAPHLAHLAALTVAFGAIARVALRRFA